MLHIIASQDGEEIRSLLFGARPTPREAALIAFRRSWAIRRRCQAVVLTFPGSFKRGPYPLAANDRAVRRAISELRSVS